MNFVSDTEARTVFINFWVLFTEHVFILQNQIFISPFQFISPIYVQWVKT